MGTGIDMHRKGRHIAFSGGTGVLVFIDMVAHLILRLLPSIGGPDIITEVMKNCEFLGKRILDEEEIKNPNIVKVVCNNKNDALYFSRSVIPFFRNTSSNMPTYKHIGVYAFRKDALLQFTKWNIGKIENTEMLEQLRYLENGVSIKMIETESASIGIDTPEDLELARRLYKER